VVPLVCILILFFVDFAKAMNYWLDANRVANEGARLAAVNADPLTPDAIKERFIFGEEKDSATVLICYESAAVGEPVTVQVTMPHDWTLIPDWIPGGAGGGGTWNITSRATMRQEIPATYTSTGGCT
jgi:Flp pilus assembly protein TadG